MKSGHHDILVTFAKMGTMSADELSAHHKRLRADTLDMLVRQRLLTVKLDASGIQLYSITTRGRIAIGLESPAPVVRGRSHVATGTYDGIDMTTARAGANDYQRHPSRIGNRRVWLDGRFEIIKESA